MFLCLLRLGRTGCLCFLKSSISVCVAAGFKSTVVNMFGFVEFVFVA